jgi:hypothetical protein
MSRALKTPRLPIAGTPARDEWLRPRTQRALHTGPGRSPDTRSTLRAGPACSCAAGARVVSGRARVQPFSAPRSGPSARQSRGAAVDEGWVARIVANQLPARRAGELSEPLSLSPQLPRFCPLAGGGEDLRPSFLRRGQGERAAHSKTRLATSVRAVAAPGVGLGHAFPTDRARRLRHPSPPIRHETKVPDPYRLRKAQATLVLRGRSRGTPLPPSCDGGPGPAQSWSRITRNDP